METLYVAHGQHVSLIENGRDRTITTLHTLRNNSITLLRYNNVLYCFKCNKVFLYNEDTRQFISQFDAESDVESVVCVFKHPEQDTVYMVYPDGIYAMHENDPNTFRLNNAYASTITSACQFGDFFAISTHKIPYVFRFTDTEFSRVLYTPLRNLNLINIGGAHLCAPEVGNKFNLITRNWIIRLSIEEDDSSSEEESEEFSDDESESLGSSDSEQEAEHDASGGGPPVGSKRRQTLDESDPAFERKRKVMLQRALQFLTEEERQVILNAPQELLRKYARKNVLFVCSFK